MPSSNYVWHKQKYINLSIFQIVSIVEFEFQQ